MGKATTEEEGSHKGRGFKKRKPTAVWDKVHFTASLTTLAGKHPKKQKFSQAPDGGYMGPRNITQTLCILGSPNKNIIGVSKTKSWPANHLDAPL